MLENIIKKIFWAIVYFSGINWFYNKIFPNKLVLIGGHSVSSNNKTYKDLSIDRNFLEDQIKYLLKQGYTFLNFERIDKLQELPRKSVVMYFDDGFKDIYFNAYPIFKKYNLPFTLFVTTDFINGEQIYLSWEQIREMTDLAEIGCHGKTHRDFIDLTEKELKKELSVSAQIIKEQTGQKPIALSYPHGKYNQEVKDIIQKAGFRFAVATNRGKADIKDRFELKKVVIYPRDTMTIFKLKLGIFYRIKSLIK